jgi:hypothetical protein
MTTLVNGLALFGMALIRFGGRSTGKKTPVTSSHRIPPTRLKGRRKPPTPCATPRVVFPAAWPALRDCTADAVAVAC